MSFQTLLLDLDDTILDFGAAERAAISRTFREIGLEPTEALLRRYSEINESQWEAMERGEIDRAMVLIRRFDIFFEELGMEADSRAVDRYRSYLGVGRLKNGTIEISARDKSMQERKPVDEAVDFVYNYVVDELAKLDCRL